MPKSIIIEPEKVFAAGRRSHFSDIPVNAYDKTIEQELATYSAEDFLHIWQRHVRHPGVRDHPQRDQDQGRVQGRHVQPRRSRAPLDRAGSGGGRHGVLARARRPHLRLASQPRRDPGQGLFRDPQAQRRRSCCEIMQIVSRRRAAPAGREGLQRAASRAWRVRFFVYGAYSEIFARETGFNRGLGGSMHAFFAPFGIYPNNAIVGGSGSIAPGAALFKRVNRQAGHRGREHRRRVVRLRPGVGRHHVLRDGPVPHAVGSSRSAAACRSSSTA